MSSGMSQHSTNPAAHDASERSATAPTTLLPVYLVALTHLTTSPIAVNRGYPLWSSLLSVGDADHIHLARRLA